MSSKFRRDLRDMDEDEECWFQNDDDVDDVVDDDPTMDGCFNTIGRLEDTFDSEEMTPSKKERKSTLGPYPVLDGKGGKPVNGNARRSPTEVPASEGSPPDTSTRKPPLVDYEDDSDEEEEADDDETDETMPAAKRARQSTD